MLFLDELSNLTALLRNGLFSITGKINILLRFVLIGVGLSLCGINSYAEEWVPVYEEPKHKLEFENEHTMILNVNLPPGYVSLYHKHVIDLLYITIVGTKVWAEPLGGKKREADVKTGDLRFSSDNHGLPHVHRVGNIGTTPFHVIGIAIKDDISTGVTPLSGDTSGLQKTMEKAHASVYRIKLESGEKTGIHQHNLPYAQVYLSSGILVNDVGEITQVEAGQYKWHAGGSSHSYENIDKEPIEIIEMQWR